MALLLQQLDAGNRTLSPSASPSAAPSDESSSNVAVVRNNWQAWAWLAMRLPWTSRVAVKWNAIELPLALRD